MPPIDEPQEITLEQVERAMQGDIDDLQEIYVTASLSNRFSNSAKQFIIHNYQAAGPEGKFLFYLQAHEDGTRHQENKNLLDFLVDQEFPLAIHLRSREMRTDGLFKSHFTAPYDPQKGDELAGKLKNSKYRICNLYWQELNLSPDKVIRSFISTHQYYRDTQPVLSERCLRGAFFTLEKNLTPENFKILQEFCGRHPRLMTQFLEFAQKHVDKEQYAKVIGVAAGQPLFQLEKYQKAIEDTAKIFSIVQSRLKRFNDVDYADLDVNTVRNELQATKNAAENLSDINAFTQIHRKELDYYCDKNPKFNSLCKKFIAAQEKISEDLKNHEKLCQDVVDDLSRFASRPK